MKFIPSAITLSPNPITIKVIANYYDGTRVAVSQKMLTFADESFKLWIITMSFQFRSQLWHTE